MKKKKGQKGQKGKMKKKKSQKGKMKKKSLYICTCEYRDYGNVFYVIHAIKLSDLLSCSCPDPSKCRSCSSKGKAESPLRYLDSLGDVFFPTHMGCGVFGSQIIFAGGADSTPIPRDRSFPGVHLLDGDLTVHVDLDRTEVEGCSRLGPNLSKRLFAFNSADKNPKIIEASKEFGIMQAGKARPLLVELEGKLFALDGSHDEMYLCYMERPYFEVFNPTDRKWLPLPQPPFFCDRFAPYSYLIAGSMIILSTENNRHLFGFDVTEEEPWGYVLDQYDGPFSFDRALAVEEDDGWLVFTYEEDADEPVAVYLLSDPRMDKIASLKLPHPLTPEFLLSFDYRFVHLGGRKVCLVMTAYMCPEPNEDGEDRSRVENMGVYFITFEYFSQKVHSKINWQVRLLGTRFLDCNIKQPDRRFYNCNAKRSNTSPCNFGLELLGCFVL